MKKHIIRILAVILMISLFVLPVSAEDAFFVEDDFAVTEESYSEDAFYADAGSEDTDDLILDSGTIGSISWSIVSVYNSAQGMYERVLNVSGSGAIPDFENPNNGCYKDRQTPWFKNRWWSDVGSAEGCYLRGITIGSGITSIGEYAFAPYTPYANHIAEITIPDTVTFIGAGAFSTQFDLSRVIIPDSVTSIGENAFDHRTTIVCSPDSAAYQYAVQNGNPTEIKGLTLDLTVGKKNVKEITIKRGDVIPYTVSCNVSGITPRVSFYTSGSVSDLITIDQDAQTITSPIKGNSQTGGTAYLTASVGNVSVSCTIHVKDRYAVTYYNGFPGTSKNKLKTDSYNEGTTFKLAKCPVTKKGYRFGGWVYVTDTTVDSQGCYKYTFDPITSISGSDLDVFANWIKVSVSKVSGVTLKNIKTRKLTVSFTKYGGVKGYQVQYDTKSTFLKSSRTTKTVTENKATLTGLTKNKTYYVRVRAFKTDSTGARVYGAWSTVKKIKITK